MMNEDFERFKKRDGFFNRLPFFLWVATTHENAL